MTSASVFEPAPLQGGAPEENMTTETGASHGAPADAKILAAFVEL
ncbi:unnamed protein product [Clonostachys rosea f. rosea IK726]|uniref:Uncharacterized protein n=2 Tax=Bionectria ochroleuca TaxID=29856 RepID=A0A0B7JWP7_BIOOC|nr:unnamed protein product [Clonostachys rosea f. rosea IK726]